MEKQTKERVYGEYPGSLSKSEVDQLNDWLENDPKRAEVAIHIMMYKLGCNDYGDILFNTRHDEMLRRQDEENHYAIYYLIRQTEHFGVTIERIRSCNRSFEKWDVFWHNYIETLDTATWEKFEFAIFNGGDITPYLPAKAWNEE